MKRLLLRLIPLFLEHLGVHFAVVPLGHQMGHFSLLGLLAPSSLFLPSGKSAHANFNDPPMDSAVFAIFDATPAQRKASNNDQEKKRKHSTSPKPASSKTKIFRSPPRSQFLAQKVAAQGPFWPPTGGPDRDDEKNQKKS